MAGILSIDISLAFLCFRSLFFVLIFSRVHPTLCRLFEDIEILSKTPTTNAIENPRYWKCFISMPACLPPIHFIFLQPLKPAGYIFNKLKCEILFHSN